MKRLIHAAAISVLADGDELARNRGPDSRKNSAGDVMRREEQSMAIQPVVACEEPFNISPYFFVSRQVASVFPHLYESHMIERFRSVVPNRPYSRSRWGMYDGRMTLRWAACVHSSAALIAYIVMTVVTAFPELEYYMSTTVGWLMVGFLSRFGKFTALGVQVDLRGYVVVVMVICFYALLFLIGRWATKVLREQYKLTDKGLAARKRKKRLLKTVNSHKVSGRIAYGDGAIEPDNCEPNTTRACSHSGIPKYESEMSLQQRNLERMPHQLRDDDDKNEIVDYDDSGRHTDCEGGGFSRVNSGSDSDSDSDSDDSNDSCESSESDESGEHGGVDSNSSDSDISNDSESDNNSDRGRPNSFESRWPQ
jgi:hypothetical protein